MQKKKRTSVPPGNWMGPPNSSGVRASESFFERSPTQRNNKRGTSTPTHIGMLPNNVIREINRIAGGKELSHAIELARLLRSLKVFALNRVPHRINRPRVVYDPKYKTVLTNNDVRPYSTWAKLKYSLTNNKPFKVYSARTGKTPRSPRNSPTHNEVKASISLNKLRQRAAKAGSRSTKKVQNNNVLFYSVYHPNMKSGPSSRVYAAKDLKNSNLLT